MEMGNVVYTIGRCKCINIYASRPLQNSRFITSNQHAARSHQLTS